MPTHRTPLVPLLTFYADVVLPLVRGAKVNPAGRRLRGHVVGRYCGPGGRHLLITIYTRPWRRFFRATHETRCWECDVVIREP